MKQPKTVNTEKWGGSCLTLSLPRSDPQVSQVTEISKTKGQPNSVAILIKVIYISCPDSSIPQTPNFAQCPPAFCFPSPCFLSARGACPHSQYRNFPAVCSSQKQKPLQICHKHWTISGRVHPEMATLGKAAMEKQTGPFLTSFCSSTFSNGIKC